MRPLTKTGAAHFCGGFSNLNATSAQSIREFLSTLQLGRTIVVTEQTPRYGQYRDALLREADRAIFLAVSCFRRAHDLWLPSSAFWAHVTLYYASWYSARSILAMLGCWADGEMVIEVQADAPGRQSFVIRRSAAAVGSSHKNFWQAYYDAMRRYSLWLDPSFSIAVSPVNNNDYWQIERRNTLNYQSVEAWKLLSLFESRFNAQDFPRSLPGDTATQYEVTRAMLLLSASLAGEFALVTNTFASLGGTRSRSIEAFIYDADIPDVSVHAERQALVI